jgi:hypothetical protein
MKCDIHTSDHTWFINVAFIHMFYSNKKVVDIVTSHAILAQFCIQLFSFMAGLEQQQNLIE